MADSTSRSRFSSSRSPTQDGRFAFLPDKDFFTAQEAAKFLSCTKATIYNMIRDSRLEAARIRGGYIRIHRSALIAALESYST